MLMLYNVRKDKLLIKAERRKKQRRKQMMHKNFVSYLCMTCVWKKMHALDIEPSADNSLFYFGMKEVWDQDQLLKGI